MADITIVYRNGSKDVLHGAEVVSFKDGVLEIKESNSRTVCIVIANVTYWTKEEVNK